MIESTWELKFAAHVAVNHKLNAEHVEAIQRAIIDAINKNCDHNLLVGETTLTIEPKENK